MMKLSGLMGMAVICTSLLLDQRSLSVVLAPAAALPVLLSHRCELTGDGRPIFIRYALDHSSFVNSVPELMEGDLRRELVGIMASRQERIVFFAGDDRLTYGDVTDVISDLQHDDPSLHIVLLMKTQVPFNHLINFQDESETCVSVP